MVDLPTLRFVGERIEEAKRANPPIADRFVLLLYSEVTVYPHLAEALQILAHVNGPDKWITTNAFCLVRSRDVLARLETLKAHGFGGVQITFHGMSETHDVLVKRKGAFDDLIELAHVALEVGMNLYCFIFLNRLNAPQANTLSEQLRALKKEGAVQVCAHVPVPCGRAAIHSDIWLDEDDLSLLSQDLIDGMPSPVGSERDWIEKILSGTWDVVRDGGSNPDLRVFSLRVTPALDVRLHVLEGHRWHHHAGNLRDDTLGVIISRLRNDPGPAAKLRDGADIQFLAEHFGDRTGRKIFSQQGVRAKWLAALLSERLTE